MVKRIMARRNPFLFFFQIFCFYVNMESKDKQMSDNKEYVL